MKMKSKTLQKINKATAKKTLTKRSTVKAMEKKKPDPTRYGDWVKNGRCIDF